MSTVNIPDFGLRLALEEALVDLGTSQFHVKLEALQEKAWEADDDGDEAARKKAEKAMLKLLHEVRDTPVSRKDLASITKLTDVTTLGEYFDEEWFGELASDHSSVDDFTGLEGCVHLETIELVNHGSPKLDPLKGLSQLHMLHLFTDMEPPQYEDLTPLLELPALKNFLLPGMEKHKSVVSKVRKNNPDNRRIDELQKTTAQGKKALQGEDFSTALGLTEGIGERPKGLLVGRPWQEAAQVRVEAFLGLQRLEEAHQLLAKLDNMWSLSLLRLFWKAWAEKADLVLSPLVEALVDKTFLTTEQVRQLCSLDKLQNLSYRNDDFQGEARFTHDDEAWALQVEFVKVGHGLLISWAQLLPSAALMKMSLARGAMDMNSRDEAVSHILAVAKICHGAGLREYAARAMNDVRANFPEHRDRIKGMEDEPQTELSERLLEKVFEQL